MPMPLEHVFLRVFRLICSHVSNVIDYDPMDFAASMGALPKYAPPPFYPIFVLTPENALPHRRIAISSQLKGVQYDIVTMGGHDIDSRCEAQGSEVVGTTWFRKACTAHLKLMQSLVDGPDDIQLVLSDTFALMDNTTDLISQVNSRLAQLPATWQVLWLHTDMDVSDRLTMTDGSLKRDFGKVGPLNTYSFHGDISTHAMTYTKAFAREVLARYMATEGSADLGHPFAEIAIASGSAPLVTLPPLIEIDSSFGRGKPKTKKNLVLAAALDVSQVPNWIGSEEDASWDLGVLYYGSNPYFDCPQCITMHRSRGAYKFALLKEFMKTSFWLHNKDKYAAVMFADDDLLMDVHTINIAFHMFTHFKLKLAQQSVCTHKNSNTWMPQLHQTPKFALRYTSWVEIMAPIFETSFLNGLVQDTLAGAYSGFGLDSVWPFLLGYPKNQIAILDAVCMGHPKSDPLHLRHREFVELQAPINPWVEEGLTLGKYGVSEESVAAYGMPWRPVKMYANVSLESYLSAVDGDGDEGIWDDGQGRKYVERHAAPNTIGQLREIIADLELHKHRVQTTTKIVLSVMGASIVAGFVVLYGVRAAQKGYGYGARWIGFIQNWRGTRRRVVALTPTNSRNQLEL